MLTRLLPLLLLAACATGTCGDADVALTEVHEAERNDVTGLDAALRGGGLIGATGTDAWERT